MKVFISWSGARSERYAKLLAAWLPDVIQALDPFVSSSDIYKGANWQSTIWQALASSDFGILCLTRDNQNAPWLLFEAGALAGRFGGSDSRVCPIVFEDGPLPSAPLSTFQGCLRCDESEMLKLVESLNVAPRGGKATGPLLHDAALARAFSRCWDSFYRDVQAVQQEAGQPASPIKTEADSHLDEIRGLLRQINVRIDQAVGTGP